LATDPNIGNILSFSVRVPRYHTLKLKEVGIQRQSRKNKLERLIDAVGPCSVLGEKPTGRPPFVS